MILTNCCSKQLEDDTLQFSGYNSMELITNNLKTDSRMHRSYLKGEMVYKYIVIIFWAEPEKAIELDLLDANSSVAITVCQTNTS
jgi:hypothetical protein